MVPDDADESDEESLVVDENPSRSRKEKDPKTGKLKLKLSCMYSVFLYKTCSWSYKPVQIYESAFLSTRYSVSL